MHSHLEVPNSRAWSDRLYAIDVRTIGGSRSGPADWTFNVVGKHAEDAIARLRRNGLPYHDTGADYSAFTITNVRDLGQIHLK